MGCWRRLDEGGGELHLQRFSLELLQRCLMQDSQENILSVR